MINVLSNNRCIRHLVFPALLQSISMSVIDYMCIKSIAEYSQSIILRLLLKLFEVPFYGRIHNFTGHVMYVTLKIA